MSVTQWFFAIVIGAAIGFLIPLPERHAAAPGTAPTQPFEDRGEVYSADGCWVRSNTGYWHPLRRCHIVRIPESDVSWAKGSSDTPHEMK